MGHGDLPKAHKGAACAKQQEANDVDLRRHLLFRNHAQPAVQQRLDGLTFTFPVDYQKVDANQPQARPMFDRMRTIGDQLRCGANNSCQLQRITLVIWGFVADLSSLVQ